MMAPMAVETHVALCEPAMMAGQPGHCNLMSYRTDGNYWYTAVEQAFAGGANVTWGAWLFNEIGTTPDLDSQNDRPWARAEYQIGLAQAMNVGLARYIDTRIAVNLYLHLGESDKAVLGKALLGEALHRNPYNPAPWYLMGGALTDGKDRVALAQIAIDQARGRNDGLPQPAEDSAGDYRQIILPDSVKDSVHDYWQIVRDKVIECALLDQPKPKDRAAAQAAYDMIKTLHNIPTSLEVSYVVSLEGPQVEEDRLEDLLRKHLDVAKGIESSDNQQRFADELRAFLVTVDRSEVDHFLNHLIDDFPYFAKGDPYLGIIKVEQESEAAAMATNQSNPNPIQLTILSATYGDLSNTERTMDLTERLRDTLRAGQDRVTISNHFAGDKDPAPFTVKQIEIIYAIDGERKERVFSENSTINLSADLN